MKVLLQRVTEARVSVAGDVTGEIRNGLLLFVGFGQSDEALPEQRMLGEIINKACSKVVNLRVFSNSQGKLDHSILETGGNILLVPQFTLYGKSQKGRRPDFTDAMTPDRAEASYEELKASMERALGKPVSSGIFGADMAVSLINDGPFTLQMTF